MNIIDEKTFKHIRECVQREDIENIVKLYIDNDCSFRLMEEICESDNLDLLKNLWLLGFHITKDLADISVSRGCLDIARWCRNRGVMYDEKTCLLAAQSGKIKLLEWLRKEDVPWNDVILLQCIFRGNDKILVWAIENGCPVTNRVCNNSLIFGSSEAIECIHNARRDYNWGCNEGRCYSCNEKIDTITKFEEGYMTWLSDRWL